MWYYSWRQIYKSEWNMADLLYCNTITYNQKVLYIAREVEIKLRFSIDKLALELTSELICEML